MHFGVKTKVFVAIMIVFMIETIMSTDTRYIERLTNPEEKPKEESVKTDTIPLVDRKGDFITDKTYNPFDVFPSTIKQYSFFVSISFVGVI